MAGALPPHPDIMARPLKKELYCGFPFQSTTIIITRLFWRGNLSEHYVINCAGRGTELCQAINIVYAKIRKIYVKISHLCFLK